MHVEGLKTKVAETTSLDEIVQALHQEVPGCSWVGIYRVEGDDLVLDAWKGPRATEHTRIPKGRGICGIVAITGETEIVPRVQEDSRYLLCFPSTRSEIVVPIRLGALILGEIDIDSDEEDAFGEEQRILLEELASVLAANWLNYRRMVHKSGGGRDDKSECGMER
jgi:GAF domain-containing protein